MANIMTTRTGTGISFTNKLLITYIEKDSSEETEVEFHSFIGRIGRKSSYKRIPFFPGGHSLRLRPHRCGSWGRGRECPPSSCIPTHAGFRSESGENPATKEFPFSPEVTLFAFDPIGAAPGVGEGNVHPHLVFLRMRASDLNRAKIQLQKNSLFPRRSLSSPSTP